jgi:hypothetical protein
VGQALDGGAADHDGAALRRARPPWPSAAGRRRSRSRRRRRPGPGSRTRSGPARVVGVAPAHLAAAGGDDVRGVGGVAFAHDDSRRARTGAARTSRRRAGSRAAPRRGRRRSWNGAAGSGAIAFIAMCDSMRRRLDRHGGALGRSAPPRPLRGAPARHGRPFVGGRAGQRACRASRRPEHVGAHVDASLARACSGAMYATCRRRCPSGSDRPSTIERSSDDLGAAPVHHVDLAVAADHDVVGLEVAVHDAAAVRERQRVAHLDEALQDECSRSRWVRLGRR